MADPGAVISVFWTDEELKSPIYLDSVVTLVDCMHILKQLDEKKEGCVNEAQRQIAFADKIILNKKELVNCETLQKVRQTVVEINRLAVVEETSFSKVQVDSILNIRAFDKEKSFSVAESLQGVCSESCEGESHHHDIDKISEHKHDEDITTVNFVVEGKAVDLNKFTLFMSALVWEKEEESDKWEIFRMKGIVNVSGDEHKHSLQCVQQLYILEPSNILWGKEETRFNKLIFIGRFLNLERFQQLFQECIVWNLEINEKSIKYLLFSNFHHFHCVLLLLIIRLFLNSLLTLFSHDMDEKLHDRALIHQTTMRQIREVAKKEAKEILLTWIYKEWKKQFGKTLILNKNIEIFFTIHTW